MENSLAMAVENIDPVGPMGETQPINSGMMNGNSMGPGGNGGFGGTGGPNMGPMPQPMRQPKPPMDPAKKKKIIEDAYQQLAVDRKALECERLNFEHEKSKYRRQKMSGSKPVHQQYESGAYDGTNFFRGVDSELSLRKRYKELLKIFHPDNKCGDTKTLLLIQTEYESLRSRYYES